MDSLITIILLIIGSGIAQWIKKKADKDQAEEWSELEDWINRDKTPREQPTPPPLQEGQAERSPSPRAPSPQIPPFGGPTTWWEKSPVPTLPRPAPKHAPAPPRIPIPPPVQQIPTTLITEPEGDHAEGTLSRLDESRIAYERATQLHQNVAARLREQAEATARHRRGVRKTNEDRAALRRMLQSPQTMRQAILATVILSPPKAVQE